MNRWCDQDAGLLTDHSRKMFGDQGIGSQREVIAVLLEASDRYDDRLFVLQVPSYLLDGHLAHFGEESVRIVCGHGFVPQLDSY